MNSDSLLCGALFSVPAQVVAWVIADNVVWNGELKWGASSLSLFDCVLEQRMQPKTSEAPQFDSNDQYGTSDDSLLPLPLDMWDVMPNIEI
ncbi:hypothetical protein CDL15_Pgr011666 [Punica granatum]|uniref:Uncharacterized protein n=1 Tax=Punica granatum TaxID=22663 RepID=A0A218WXK5_PUNGR|nr:hypothetical protein CDL15_Pgr011666 [Punica granatum]